MDSIWIFVFSLPTRHMARRTTIRWGTGATPRAATSRCSRAATACPTCSTATAMEDTGRWNRTVFTVTFVPFTDAGLHWQPPYLLPLVKLLLSDMSYSHHIHLYIFINVIYSTCIHNNNNFFCINIKGLCKLVIESNALNYEHIPFLRQHNKPASYLRWTLPDCHCCVNILYNRYHI